MDLLLLGGVSGSGKSVALAAFEDAGYYTVNNLPVPLVVETADYLARGGQARVAIALDVKTGPGLPGLAEAMTTLGTRGWNVRFIYLDATVETLVKRFSETRRRHPFSSGDRTLTEAIEYERDLLADARRLGMSFDTSELPAAGLRAWIKDFVSLDPSQITLQLESFGFKHGLPLDADLVFDARCLPNPHYEPALSALTGKHADVVTFLETIPEVERMYGDIY
ncbi:MAG: RNase adapter RapZ, partial [Betaproteobacteria bacterium]